MDIDRQGEDGGDPSNTMEQNTTTAGPIDAEQREQSNRSEPQSFQSTAVDIGINRWPLSAFETASNGLRTAPCAIVGFSLPFGLFEHKVLCGFSN